VKNKIAALCVLSAFVVSLSACDEKTEMTESSNKNQTDVSVSESLETTAQTEEEKHITASAEALNNSTEKGTSNEIPTDGCSDTDFMRRYVDEAENLYIVSQIIGSEEYENWVENVYLAKSSEEQNELPALYQIIHDLNISKEDFVAQNNEFIDYPDMYYSEEVISALYLEDIEEMKKQLVNPLALYYDGEIYTFDELSEAQNTQTAADISADVISEYLGYIEMVCDESGILKCMQEDIDSVRKKYQLDSDQAGLNSDEEETGENTTDSSGLLDDIDMLNEMSDNFSVVSKPLLDVTPEIWGISLSADNITSAGLTVVITQSDGEKPIGDYFTGSWYELQKKLGDEWTAVEYLPQEYDISWTDEAYSIPENALVSFDIDWEWLYGELPRGEYRITKKIMTGSGATLESRHYYAEFVIE